MVGCEVDQVQYWIATDRHELKAGQIAYVDQLRWTVESFFAWWKQHLKVCHILARSRCGLMVQILAGLIPACCSSFTADRIIKRRSASDESENSDSESKMRPPR